MRIAVRSHRRRVARRRALWIEFDGATSYVQVFNAASIQDLAAGALTAKAWVRAQGYGEVNEGCIFDKTGSIACGWHLYLTPADGLVSRIRGTVLNSFTKSGVDKFVPDGRLHQLCIQFDNAGDRKTYQWIDGIPVSPYLTQNALDGDIVSDVGKNLHYGRRSDGFRAFDGLIGGWSCISKGFRHTNGVAFAVRKPTDPPPIDANTMLQFNYGDGQGTTLTDVSGNGNHGVITNGIWRRV